MSDGSHAVPVDIVAERVCAAAVLVNPRHARGLDDLRPADFYLYPWLFGMRDDLAALDTLAEREAAAAAACSPAAVRGLAAGVPVMWGFGRWAERVRAAADTRRYHAALQGGLEALEAGAAVPEARVLVASLYGAQNGSEEARALARADWRVGTRLVANGGAVVELVTADA